MVLTSPCLELWSPLPESRMFPPWSTKRRTWILLGCINGCTDSSWVGMKQNTVGRLVLQRNCICPMCILCKFYHIFSPKLIHGTYNTCISHISATGGWNACSQTQWRWEKKAREGREMLNSEDSAGTSTKEHKLILNKRMLKIRFLKAGSMKI